MPYRYDQVEQLEKHELVGNEQCVAVVQVFAGAPVTANWRQGEAVVGNRLLRKGTAIATFVDGRYPNRPHGNHAALYLRQGIGGIHVMDQWKTKKSHQISSRCIPSLRKDKNGNYVSPSDNADAFFVIR
ncbi:BPSL0067 family protein [Pseudoduganella eburnea]|uniref:BPSL0067 family protein n=1 Tax=Massilia eburnea TaxID=1776165 RepID=A0A6L6QDI4_9BURK|nr:BPSL0067 family protein [Massilia eburnea]MTW10229.1 BPSL0067 family protein [Massilia eburnea]